MIALNCGNRQSYIMPSGAFLHFFYMMRSDIIRRKMSELFSMSPKWTDFHCSIRACLQCCLGLEGFWKIRIDNIFLRILDNVRQGGNQNDLNAVMSMQFEYEESVWRVRVARFLRAYHEP